MARPDKDRTINSQDNFEGKTYEPTPKATTQSDVQLWSAFKSGNESAFITIYNTYFPMLYRYGFQYTRDKALIKDAIQDLFVELRQKRKRLSYTTSIKLYLYKSIRRKILGHKEKAINKITTNQDLEGYNFEVVFSIENQLISQQLNEENILRLNRARTYLTKRQKQAIYYFYYEDLSYEEVSDIMGLNNIKSTRNLIYKAINILKDNMA